MAELKPMEVIMRIDFVASDGEQICAHAEKVQELIRCRDCKYYNDEEHLCNDLMGFGRYWEEGDYCSFAKRRTDG